MNEHLHRADGLEEAKRLLKNRAGIVEVAWCGNDECGHKIEQDTEASILGTPEDSEQKAEGNCVVCGKKAKAILRTAITY
jgi:prolyl-tRNA synthetase